MRAKNQEFFGFIIFCLVVCICIGLSGAFFVSLFGCIFDILVAFVLVGMLVGCGVHIF